MNIFLNVGISTFGVFIAVAFTGILVGLIAFSIVEHNRFYIQKNVIDKLFEIPIKKHNYKRINECILCYHLGVKPEYLFTLPYRHLCGKISEKIQEEFNKITTNNSNNNDITNKSLTDDMITACGENTFNNSQFNLNKLAAIRHLDTIQLELYKRSEIYAKNVSYAISVLIFSFIFYINFDVIYSNNSDNYSLKYIVKLLSSILIFIFMLFFFAYSSSIISVLTFRWIDRVTSAR